MNPVRVDFLNGETITLECVGSVNDVKVRISQLRRPFLPPEVVLICDGRILIHDETPVPDHVSVLLCPEKHRNESFWKTAFASYVAFGDIAGIDLCVQMLLALDANSISRLLSDAAVDGNLPVIQALIANKSKIPEAVNAQNEDGWTPLQISAFFGKVDVVGVLLDCDGLDVNMQNRYGCTALHLAVRYGQNSAAQTLLGFSSREKCDINIRDECGRTALHLVADADKIEIMEQLLLRDEVAINARNKFGSTALHLAVRSGLQSNVKALLNQRGILANIRDERGRTALHFAARMGRAESVELLLGKNSDVNIQNEHGSTALHLAVCGGYGGIIEMLLGSKNVVASLQDECGKTPLHHAADLGLFDVVKMLVAKTSLDTKDESGHTALDLAEKQNYRDVCEVLGGGRKRRKYSKSRERD